jgi:hypothetical protein
MFHWFDWLGVLPALDQLREAVLPVHALVPSWVVYSLPTGLYILSLINFCWFMNMPGTEAALKWGAGAGGLMVAGEVVQLFFPVLGTFSIGDLGADVLVILMSQPALCVLSKTP